MPLRRAVFGSVAALAAAGLALAPGASRTLCPMRAGDDTTRVQAAIAAARAGDTIRFAPGAYRLRTVTLKSGVALRGRGARLLALGDDPVVALDPADSHDIHIDGTDLRGHRQDARARRRRNSSATAGAMRRATSPSPAARFENKRTLLFVALRRGRIDGNSFSGIGEGGAAIGLSGRRQFVLAQCPAQCLAGRQPHPERRSGAGAQHRRRRQFREGVSRMAIEIQGSDPPAPIESRGLRVTRNHFAHWVRPVADGNTIAYSIVTDGGVGTQVLDNYARGRLVSTGIGIEIAGTDALVSGNYIEGFGAGVIGYARA